MVPQNLKDKVPPHNDEAEKATLGAVLLDPEAIGDVLRFLRSDDFYRGAHKKIFQAVLELFDRGEPIDLITLTETLRNKGLLDECGGAAYVSGLTSVVPTSANVEYYARVIRENSIRRNLVRISSEIVASAHDETRSGREIIEEAERRIFEITDQNQGGQYKTAKEVVKKTFDAIERLYNSGEAHTGIPSGFPELDKMTDGFQNSEFIIVGARPSVGKTAFALSMASHMAIKKKIPTAIFTLEMSDMALMQRLFSAEARVNSNALRSGVMRTSDFQKLMEAGGKIYDAPLFIEDTPNMKLLDLRAQARRLKAQEDIKVLFIDYIGLIEPESKDIPRHEQVGEISRSLKSLARELEIPVICLSQVGRQSEGKEPTLADLRESGSIEQDADVVMFLHRERGSNGEEEGDQGAANTKLNLAKQRNGPTDNVDILFIPQYTLFVSKSNEDY